MNNLNVFVKSSNKGNNRNFMNDGNLSLSAKGMLSYLMTCTENIDIDKIAKDNKNGKRSIYSIFTELECLGYLVKIQQRSDGKFSNNLYIILLDSDCGNLDIDSIASVCHKTDSAERANGGCVDGVCADVQMNTVKQDSCEESPESIKYNSNNNNKYIKYINKLLLVNNYKGKERTCQPPKIKKDKNFIKLQKRICDTIGSSIDDKGIHRLLKESNIETINKYLEVWNRFERNGKKTGGFFICAVLEEYTIPLDFEDKKNNQTCSTYKPPQSTNYEQRKYDDEFFNGLYDNVTFVKD